MGKLCLSDDAEMVISRWAPLLVWTVLASSWPEAASAAPLLVLHRQASTNGVNIAAAAGGGQPSQPLVAGVAVGLACIVLAAITAIVCYHPRTWVRRSKLQPMKPWINATTTTTITSYSRSSRSGSSGSSESFAHHGPATATALALAPPVPVPMTRVTTIDKNGRYTNTLVEDVPEAFAMPGPPSTTTRRPPAAALQRYSVHVTSDGGRTGLLLMGGGGGGGGGRNALPPLPEESGAALKLPPPVRPPVPRSDLADRRGRPALQSIQVPSPTDSAGGSGKGKGKAKARVYFY